VIQFETVQLLDARARGYAIANILANLAGGLGAAAVGLWVGTKLLP
jgi:fluoride ion exporter CrcB/FEX